MAAQSMASNAQLQKTLRSDGPRKSKGADPACMLNQVQGPPQLHDVPQLHILAMAERRERERHEAPLALCAPRHPPIHWAI